jgi:hypothetical protein
MRWRWKYSASLVLPGCVSLVAFAWAQAAYSCPPPVVHTLTPEKNGQVIHVREGDTLIVKLPIQTPFRWTLFGEAAELTRLKTPLKLEPIGKSKDESLPPKVGGPKLVELHYKVKVQPKHRLIQWIYQSPIPAPGNTPPEPGTPLRRGESPSKGSVFRVTLEPSP